MLETNTERSVFVARQVSFYFREVRKGLTVLASL